jgi:hypothetical protein
MNLSLVRTFLFWLLAGVSILCPAAANADTALYRWQNSDGKIVFGSKPPANARDVTTVSGRSFSRYSSKKLITGYGYKSKAPDTKTDKQVEVISETQGIDSALPLVAKLSHGQVLHEVNANSEVTKCEVEIQNSGGETADSIRVSFSFADGTLVPADGPAKLKSGEKARFFLPTSRLPIKLGEEASNVAQGDDTSPTGAAPEVVSDFISTPES